MFENMSEISFIHNNYRNFFKIFSKILLVLGEFSSLRGWNKILSIKYLNKYIIFMIQ